MIQITPSISIDPNDIKWSFIRASGPGGQHVNKTASAVQLRFNVDPNPNLPPDVRHRLLQIAGHRMAADGTLVIDARRFRSQIRNREDALERLIGLIKQAVYRPTKRKKTGLPRKSKRRRLETKRQRGALKRQRRSVSHTEE